MIVLSSTNLAKSLDGRAGAGLPSTIQRWPRPEQSRSSAGPVPEWVIAGAAFAIRQLPGMAMFNPMMLSMAIGIAFHHIVGTVAWAKPSVTFGVRWLLCIAASAVIAANAGDEEVACAIACVSVSGSVAIFAHPVPADAHAWIVAATAFLSIALAAIGMETNIGKLTAKGFRPAWLGTLALLFIAGFSLTLIKLME
jgi:uncharacterized membrane protein YadS